jgi:hypothetical protein
MYKEKLQTIFSSHVKIKIFQKPRQKKNYFANMASLTRISACTEIGREIHLKVYSSHLNWGARLYSFDLLLNTRCPASFEKKF